MRGQWSFSFALIALLAVIFAIVVIFLAAPRFNPIDYSEDLYLLKNKSIIANNTIYFTTWDGRLCDSSSITQYFKSNITVYYYLKKDSQRYLMAARLSRADKIANYTFYLCLLSCQRAIGPGGIPGYLFYISAYSTLDYLPTLEMNGTFLEYATLNVVEDRYAPLGYYMPSAPLIVAFSNTPSIRIVDYPVSVSFRCPSS